MRPSSERAAALAIIVPHRIIWSWYTGHWWVGCYIWYSEEGTGRGRSPPRPLLAVDLPNVTAHPSTASVPITVLLCNGPLLRGLTVSVNKSHIKEGKDQKHVKYVTRPMYVSHHAAEVELRHCILSSLQSRHRNIAAYLVVSYYVRRPVIIQCDHRQQSNHRRFEQKNIVF